MPAVLHAIGATKDAIDKAVDHAKDLQKAKEECEACEQKYVADDHELNLEERKVQMKKTEAETKKAEPTPRRPYLRLLGGAGRRHLRSERR